MCGIIGGVHNHFARDGFKEKFAVGLGKLSHRGPDDNGLECSVFSGKHVVLGHSRLSIIDLRQSGHQPMGSRCGRYRIIFNGEIYNYKELREELHEKGFSFRSDSDTEVLLSCWEQWGKSCLPKLRGMFAFVVYDSKAGTVTCIRDAFGIKPFYYYKVEDCLFFSSEIPALLTLLPESPEPDYQKAFDYLAYSRYDDDQRTFFKNIGQLPPGHLLDIDLKCQKIQTCAERWWWPSISENSNLTFDQASDKLREMFLQNIRLHVRSDVEIGAALSGGLDSSAIVCAMKHIEPELPIKTFSFIAQQSSKNEESWIDFINQHVSALPNKIIASGGELANDLEDLIQYQGEPFGSTSIYAQYRVFKEAREKGVIVTLDGQGADELMGGYHGYPSSRFYSLIDQSDYKSLLKLMNNWSKWPGRNHAKAVFHLMMPFLSDRNSSMAHRAMGYNPSPDWLQVNAFREAGVTMFPKASVRMEEGAGRRLMEELRTSLSGNGLVALLRHGDRNSMRWSLESRVPFLTTDMAEFLLSLPENYLLSPGGETKHIFRHAMRGIVPDKVLYRKDKVGFETPQLSWLREMGEKILEFMECSEAIPFINSDNARNEVNAVISGKKAPNAHVWRLINYHCWYALYQGT